MHHFWWLLWQQIDPDFSITQMILGAFLMVIGVSMMASADDNWDNRAGLLWGGRCLLAGGAIMFVVGMALRFFTPRS